MLHLVVDVEQAREIYWPVATKHLPGFEFKHSAQSLDDLGIGARFDFKPHRVSLAPIVEFSAHRLEQTARLFFRQVQVAVAGHTEGSGRNNVVAVIHARSVESYQIGQKDEVVRTLGRQLYQARQGAWDGYDA